MSAASGSRVGIAFRIDRHHRIAIATTHPAPFAERSSRMVDAAEGLFAVPDLFDGAVAVCWSYGMGVESTCGVVRTLLEPDFRPAELRGDLSNLIVLVTQTGDEWTSTCDLVAAHVLPLLRQHAVRLVEVARKGPSAADGIVVLQDTRQPVRLHPDPEKYGLYALSAEHRGNGVLPTLGGNRTCSVISTMSSWLIVAHIVIQGDQWNFVVRSWKAKRLRLDSEPVAQQHAREVGRQAPPAAPIPATKAASSAPPLLSSPQTARVTGCLRAQRTEPQESQMAT
jgi:hypothetical protein